MAEIATPDQVVFEVVVSGSKGRQETINATEEHPFWVEGAGWHKTTALKTGMTLKDRHGQALQVVAVLQAEQTQTVFNIEVHEFHTYRMRELGSGFTTQNAVRLTTSTH